MRRLEKTDVSEDYYLKSRVWSKRKRFLTKRPKTLAKEDYNWCKIFVFLAYRIASSLALYWEYYDRVLVAPFPLTIHNSKMIPEKLLSLIDLLGA